jgi:hypothetical protein
MKRFITVGDRKFQIHPFNVKLGGGGGGGFTTAEWKFFRDRFTQKLYERNSEEGTMGIGMPTEGMRKEYATNEGGKGKKGRRNGRRV